MSLRDIAQKAVHEQPLTPAAAAAQAEQNNLPGGEIVQDPKPPLKDGAASGVADTVTKYIPTEVLTLYLAGVANGAALKALFRGFGSRVMLYWGFVAITGPVTLLIYFSLLQANQKQRPTFKDWPWFRVAAAVIAFAVWGLAVPNHPYVPNALAASAVGFLALSVTTMFGIIGRIVDEPQA